MSDGKPTGSYILYGMRASLYTGKARAYLIKQNIDYVEMVPGSRRFLKEIVPKIGRMIIPTIETPDGEIIQDSTEIIDHFEKRRDWRERAPIPPRRVSSPLRTFSSCTAARVFCARPCTTVGIFPKPTTGSSRGTSPTTSGLAHPRIRRSRPPSRE